MNNNEFDKNLKNKFNSSTNKVTSETILNTIQKCTKKTSKSKYKKVLLPSITLYFLLPALVLASTGLGINFGLKNIGFGSKKIESSINSGYMQMANGKYIYSKDVKYKFSNAIINNNLMLISLDFDFDENIEYFEGLAFSGLNITDENNRQIYIDSEDQNIWTKNIASSFINFVNTKYENHINETLVLTSPEFGEIEKVNINFDNIILYFVKDSLPLTKEIETSDNISLQVQQNKQETIKYKINSENITNNSISITQVTNNNTGLNITFDVENVFEAPKYSFELQDKSGKTLYSKTNIVSNFKNKELFSWLDIDNKINALDQFRIILKYEGNIINTYLLEK